MAIPRKKPFQITANENERAEGLPWQAYGVSVNNMSAQWLDLGGQRFIGPSSRGTFSLDGDQVATFKWNAPPGVIQPVAATGQIATLVYTDMALPDAGGPILGNTVASVVTLERFLKANIPTPGNAGRLIEVTDYDKSIWLDNGVNFFSLTHEVFDVKAYGAKGDGLTNDDAAVNAAKNALIAAGGGILFFAPGVYPITTFAIQDFTGGLVIQGSGNFRTVIRGPNAVNPIVLNFFSLNGSGNVGQFVVRDISVSYDGASTNTMGIRVWNALHFVFDHVTCYANGIPWNIQGSGQGTFIECEGYSGQAPPAGSAGLSIGNGAGALTSAGPLNFVGGQYQGGSPASFDPAVRLGPGAFSIVFHSVQFQNGGAGQLATVEIDGNFTMVDFFECHGESNFNSSAHTGVDYRIGATAKVDHVGIYGGDYHGHGDGVNTQQYGVKVIRCKSFVCEGVTWWGNNVATAYDGGGIRFDATFPAAGDTMRIGANAIKNVPAGLFLSDANGVVPTTYQGAIRILPIQVATGIIRGGAPAYIISGGNNRYAAWTFADALTQEILFVVPYPRDITIGDWSVVLDWTNMSAAAGSVVWQITAKTEVDGGDLGTNADAGIVSAAVVAPAQNILKRTSFGAPNVFPNGAGLITFSIARVGADVNDTLAGTAGLVAIELQHTGLQG